MEESFLVIWYYWYKTYLKLSDKSHEQTLKQIDILKNTYQLQCIEPFIIQKIKQKHKTQIDKLSNKSSSSSPRDSSNAIYIVYPAQQFQNMETLLRHHSMNDMISQLYSYYANVQSGYLIGTPNDIARELEEWGLKEKDEDQNQNQVRNDSLIDSYEKLENRIDQLEIGPKLGQFQGMELIQCKYKDIPHTFIRVKKSNWIECLNLGTRIKLHPCQPKTISPHLPILPRLSKFRPNPNKLLIFTSFIEQLSKNYPSYSPTITSIYQYNNLPIVFARDDGGWEIDCNYPLLCYYVAYGNVGGSLNSNLVDAHIKDNPKGALAKAIQKIAKIRQDIQNQTKKLQNQKIGLIVEADIW